MAIDAADFQNVPLFEGLTDDELTLLAGRFEERTFLEGHHLTTEGASGYLFFVILEGTAKAQVDDQNVGRLGPGDFFGEVAMLGETGRRMAVVLATSDMRAAVMFGAEFRLMENEFPQVIERLRVEMQRRLEIAGLA
jgi:voltage-gated potassium channel